MAQAPGTSTLPSPPNLGPPSGQQFFGAQQGNGSHMAPPPVPPLNIPQNNAGVPPDASGEAQSAIMSPGGGSVRRAAPEPNKRALYVGGLDPRVTEDVLKKIFETTGNVQSVKIIPDKNVRSIRLFSPHQIADPFLAKGLQLWLRRIRRSGCSRESYADS